MKLETGVVRGNRKKIRTDSWPMILRSAQKQVKRNNPDSTVDYRSEELDDTGKIAGWAPAG
jgi:hypothetical protein